GQRDGTFVLPGTHSKWVRVVDARVQSFATFMSGEFYALLRQHSILARTMPPEDGELDEDAFLRGVQRAQASESLLHAAFSARTRPPTRRYEIALAALGCRTRSLGTEASWRGLWALARTLEIA